MLTASLRPLEFFTNSPPSQGPSSLCPPLSQSHSHILSCFVTATIQLVSHLLHRAFGLPCLFPSPATSHQACFWSPSRHCGDSFLLLLLRVWETTPTYPSKDQLPRGAVLGKSWKVELVKVFIQCCLWKQTNKYLFRVPHISSGDKHQTSVGNVFNSLFENEIQTVRSNSNILGERKKCGLKFILNKYGLFSHLAVSNSFQPHGL